MCGYERGLPVSGGFAVAAPQGCLAVNAARLRDPGARLMCPHGCLPEPGKQLRRLVSTVCTCDLHSGSVCNNARAVCNAEQGTSAAQVPQRGHGPQQEGCQ
eukprot:353206-Chlamydomonas_euryale.AAC.14